MNILTVPENYSILSYEDALALIIPKIHNLINDRKLKAFCNKHKLNYRVVVMMCSNLNEREFPDALHQLLEIFGYKTEREKAFKVFNREN